LSENVQHGADHIADRIARRRYAKLMGGLIPTGLSQSAELKVWNRHNLAMLESLQSQHSNFRTFVADGPGHCGM
jgi:hypothetical protein